MIDGFKKLMRHRLIIAVCIAAVLGLYTQHAFAAGCADPQNCMPTSAAGHSGGTSSQGCDCPPGNTRFSDNGCQTSILVKHRQQAILNLASQKPERVDAGLHLAPQSHRFAICQAEWSPHSIKIDKPLLSYPIYLQTLALLL